jgi:hypothetical protein
LLEKVMVQGRRVRSDPTLDQVRAHCRENFSALPDKYKRISKQASAPVILSPRLAGLQKAVAADSRD